MGKITILRNPDSDTRTAPPNVSPSDITLGIIMHIDDVRRVMTELSNIIKSTGENHDYTKVNKLDLYCKNFEHTQVTGENFADGEWYKMHINTERHHLNNRCPDDVNLIDVLEMVTDCVCAAAARSKDGVCTVNIDPEILTNAVNNTVDLIQSMIDVKDMN